jgi:hypothetical protein
MTSAPDHDLTMLDVALGQGEAAQLAAARARIGVDQHGERDLGGSTGAQEGEAAGAIGRVDHRLGRECADAALGMWAKPAGGEETRGDRDAEGARRRVACHDRPGHGRPSCV